MSAASLIEGAYNLALKNGTALLRGVIEHMIGPDGEFYGQVPVTGGDFLAFYEDLRAREFQLPPTPIFDEQGNPAGEIPGPTVVINILEVLRSLDQTYGTNHAEKLDREFERETLRIADRVN